MYSFLNSNRNAFLIEMMLGNKFFTQNQLNKYSLSIFFRSVVSLKFFSFVSSYCCCLFSKPHFQIILKINFIQQYLTKVKYYFFNFIFRPPLSNSVNIGDLRAFIPPEGICKSKKKQQKYTNICKIG